MRNVFHLLPILAAISVLSLTSTAQAKGSLDEAIKEISNKIEVYLKEKKQLQISMGNFEGPPGNSSGRKLVNLLKAELESRDIRIAPLARWEVRGQFQVDTGDEFARVAIQIRLVNSSGVEVSEFRNRADVSIDQLEDVLAIAQPASFDGESVTVEKNLAEAAADIANAAVAIPPGNAEPREGETVAPKVAAPKVSGAKTVGPQPVNPPSANPRVARNPPAGTKPPASGNPPVVQNPPTGAKPPAAAKPPAGTKPSVAQAPPAGVRPPVGANPPAGSVPPVAQNRPAIANPPAGVNPPTGANPPPGSSPPVGPNPAGGPNQLVSTAQLPNAQTRDQRLLASIRRGGFHQVTPHMIAASPTSPYHVQVKVRHQGASIFEPIEISSVGNGLAFCDLQEGDEYSIVVTNTAPHDVGIELLIDGINSLYFSEIPGFAETGKWLIRGTNSNGGKPYSAQIRGWYRNPESVYAFHLSAEPDAVASTLGFPARIGTITATFYGAWVGDDIHPLEAKLLADLGGSKGVRIGTAKGPELGSRSEIVERYFGRFPLASVSVRYVNPDPPENLPFGEPAN